jgi:hypothetical protein
MAAVNVLVQNLYGTGTHYSNPLAWSALTSARAITANFQLSDTDAGNAANSFGWAFEHSFDGGISYDASRPSNIWTGGIVPKNAASGPPWLLPSGFESFTSSQVPPTHTRVRVELSASLSLGASLTLA